jgi:glutamate synthase domain-containing protein 3
MTGGMVVVLGRTGRNFAAGMSGGFAYIYDEDGQFSTRCNQAMVALEPVPAEDDAKLKKLIEDHHRWTGSRKAREILDQWSVVRSKFIKVFPHEYRRALSEIAQRQGEGKQEQTSKSEKVAV